MSEPKYKITGLYYSKPRLVRGADGEAMPVRTGMYVNVGLPYEANGIAPRTVESIEWDYDINSFKVYFKKGGLLVIPKHFDTEIFYEIDNGKLSNKGKQETA